MTVADFLFDKDPLFAHLNLAPDELHLYERMFETLKPQSPRPDLVIYLQAPIEVLMQRVRRRGLDYERLIDEDYLGRLADSYTRFFYDYGEAPVLMVNSAQLDFIDGDRDFALLLERVAAMRGQREYFNRGE